MLESTKVFILDQGDEAENFYAFDSILYNLCVIPINYFLMQDVTYEDYTIVRVNEDK